MSVDPCFYISTGARRKTNVSKPFELREIVSGRLPQASSSACRKCVLHSLSFFDTFSLFISLTLSFTRCISRFPPRSGLVSAFPPRKISGLHSGISQSQWTPGGEGRGEERWDCKLWLCARTVIFFITEPALTQIMECTGSLSERQWGESGPLPTPGYANPSTAVWV